MKPLEEVFEEAREISKSMCNSYMLGLRNEAIEFVPRHEYDRDAWCMGNEKYEPSLSIEEGGVLVLTDTDIKDRELSATVKKPVYGKGKCYITFNLVPSLQETMDTLLHSKEIAISTGRSEDEYYSSLGYTFVPVAFRLENTEYSEVHLFIKGVVE